MTFFEFGDKKKIIAYVTIIFCKVPCCVTYTYVFGYVSEVFATPIRGTTNGIITAFARFIGASSALVSLAIAGNPDMPLVVPCALQVIVSIP